MVYCSFPFNSESSSSMGKCEFCCLYLPVVWDQVPLHLPLRPLLKQLLVGDLTQMEIGQLGRCAFGPDAGFTLHAQLLLAVGFSLLGLL